MSNQVEVIWTALPNGFVSGSSLSLKLSLFATIRLVSSDSSPSLGDFQIGNWTESVKNFQFELEFGSVKKPATVRNEFRPDFWTALFGNSTDTTPANSKSVAHQKGGIKVKPYTKPITGNNALSNSEIITYPVGLVATRLRDVYRSLANAQSRVRTGIRMSPELASAKLEMARLTDDLSIYLPANASEEERLKTLNAIKDLDDFINTLNGDSQLKALALRAVFIGTNTNNKGHHEAAVGRLSKSGGRDLRAAAVVEIDKAIREHFPGAASISSIQESMAPFTKFLNFHSPGHEPEMKKMKADEPPEFDFHEKLTMLSNYPVLMRALGLVVDLEVTDATGIPLTSVVRAERLGDGNRHPKTHYNLDFGTRRFLPKASEVDPLIRDGLLDLRRKTGDQNDFYLETMDVDGAVLKHLSLAMSGERAKDQQGRMSALDRLEEEDAPPALRDIGISVVYSNRERFLRRLLSRAENNAQNPRDADLFAEDLVRGFRVDIFETETSNWYSLCERTEKYYFLKPGSQEVLMDWPAEGAFEREGTVHFGVTKPQLPEQGNAASLRLLQQHESLFHWNNWSLCVPLPQKPLNATTRAVSENEEPPLRLRAEFDIPSKRLPKLRFGKSFYVRCRVVDPAGNSLGKDDINKTDFSAALGDGDSPLYFSRYHSVPPPVVLVQSGINPSKSPGEQLDRLVIRDGRETSERCIAPPRTMAMTAIIDGKYDDGTDRKDGAFDGAQLCKETGDFPQARNTDPAYQSPLFLYQPANSEQPEQPYLPDPYAVGACLTMGTLGNQSVRSNVHENELACSYYREKQSWPRAQPFLFRLVPGLSGQSDIAKLRQRSSLSPFVTSAEVSLLPGEIIKVRLSSTMGDTKSNPVDTHNLEKMALWRLSTKGGTHGTQSTASPELAHRAICGEFPLYTPPRDLTLVHAVKKPLNPTLVNLVTETRKLNDTLVRLTIPMKLHRSSTGRVECEATWHEPVDDITQSECFSRPGSAHVGDEKIPLDGEVVKSNPGTPQYENFTFKFTQNFGDTKHRKVTYTMRETTRFREYYPQPKDARDEMERVKIQKQEHETFTSAQVNPENPKTILSTARPPAPQLAYVIPTFRWEQEVRKKEGPKSTRWGGGLRVYFERPWFATGEGELLGVVLYPGQMSEELRKVMTPHITQWGRDPIWGTSPLPDFPKKEDFRYIGVGGLRYEDKLTIEALRGFDPSKVGCKSAECFKVAVAGFQPEFDRDRNMWRCDLEMNPHNSYFPFVRLALVRYQPNSLGGDDDCKLSAVVQAEFMQLTPDRWANMQYESDPHRINVTVTGVSYQSRRSETKGDAITGTSIVNIALEERCSDRKGDLRWQRIALEGSSNNGLISPTNVTTNTTGETLWQFQVTLPRSRKERRYRVVIFESEIIAQDKDDNHIEYRDGSRLVYADVLGV